MLWEQMVPLDCELLQTKMIQREKGTDINAEFSDLNNYTVAM